MAEASLTAEDVRAIADLARLELSEREVALYQAQLSSILDYFQKLAEVDTSHIDAAASGLPPAHSLRADVAGQPLPVADVVANAPDSDGEQFRVPAVLAGGG